ncbi:MAG: FHA domain-containing protein [Deltaproteobacteria bacterium]|nr:FHA domain-containing protein [Deltaproteobacteria bacterium]
MTSLLLSVLARMHRGASFADFEAAHPHRWLVWEPGAWKPPSKTGETLTALCPSSPLPALGEALTLALRIRPGGSGQLSLGRAPGSDLEINDATLSSVHLVFMQTDAHRWTARDAHSRNGSWLNGTAMEPGSPHLLENGARIQAAQVCLTFYEPRGLFARLQAHPSYLVAAQLQP